MKQQISPAAFIAAIVVVVLLAAFFGFRALAPDSSKSGTAPAKMTTDQAAQYESMHSGSSGGGPRSSGQSSQYESMHNGSSSPGGSAGFGVHEYK